MKLKEYIKEKELFDSINTNDIKSNYSEIKKTLKQSKTYVPSDVIDKFETDIKNFETALEELNLSLQEEFYKNVQPDNLSKSYEIYDVRKYMAHKTKENDFWDADLQELIKSKIKKYTNYQYPGLEIMPRSKIWTKNMTGMDPLFIATKDLGVVNENLTQFHPLYQRRIRVYHYSDSSFTQLPQNTFSFIFSWNYFEFLPYDVIDKYFSGIYNLLLPGGVLLISYADCLKLPIAKLFEHEYYCYMTTELLKGVANKNGLDLIENEYYQDRISWAIIKKPGDLPKGIKEVPSLGYVKNIASEPIP